MDACRNLLSRGANRSQSKLPCRQSPSYTFSSTFCTHPLLAPCPAFSSSPARSWMGRRFNPSKSETYSTIHFIHLLLSVPLPAYHQGWSICSPSSFVGSFLGLIAQQMLQRWVDLGLWPVLGATAPIWTSGTAGRFRWTCDRRTAGSSWAAPSMRIA